MRPRNTFVLSVTCDVQRERGRGGGSLEGERVGEVIHAPMAGGAWPLRPRKPDSVRARGALPTFVSETAESPSRGAIRRKTSVATNKTKAMLEISLWRRR